MSGVWTIAWGIVLGIIILVLIMWIIGLLFFALFGESLKGAARNWTAGMGTVHYQPIAAGGK